MTRRKELSGGLTTWKPSPPKAGFKIKTQEPKSPNERTIIGKGEKRSEEG